MEKYCPQFITNLKIFLTKLKQISPTKEVSDFLKHFDQLDIGKIITKYVVSLRKSEKKLLQRDEVIFQSSLKILPGVDMKKHWVNVQDDDKKDIWNLLQAMYVLCELMVAESKGSQKEGRQKLIKDMIKNIEEHTEHDNFLLFNPYQGVDTGKDSSGLNIDELFDPDVKIPGLEKSGKPGLGSLIDMSKLKDQLKNMKKEDLDKATATIKGLLGSGADDKTTGAIESMLTDITDELQNADLDAGDPVENIFKIASNVATKMKSNVGEGGIDIEQLMKSTENLAGKALGGQGKELFGQSSGLMSMLMGGMKNMQNMTPGQASNLQNMAQNMDPSNLDPQTLQLLAKQFLGNSI